MCNCVMGDSETYFITVESGKLTNRIRSAPEKELVHNTHIVSHDIFLLLVEAISNPRRVHIGAKDSYLQEKRSVAIV
jgi:hypothetical protein